METTKKTTAGKKAPAAKKAAAAKKEPAAKKKIELTELKISKRNFERLDELKPGMTTGTPGELLRSGKDKIIEVLEAGPGQLRLKAHLGVITE